MTEMTTQTTGSLTSNPEMPIIAASAAVEVDNVIRGRETTFTNIGALAKLIKSMTDGITPTGSVTHQQKFMDPISSDIFNRAHIDSFREPIASVSDLVQKASGLADSLLKTSSNHEGDEVLASLRDFCVALAKHALANATNYSQDGKDIGYKMY